MVVVVLVVAVGAAAAWYATSSGPRQSAANAPIALTPPYLGQGGVRGDAVDIEPPMYNDWASPIGASEHISLRYSWESCDLHGKSCSTLPGLYTKRIDPPQELHIVTLRAIVTATDHAGSRSITTSPIYDMAGFPFTAPRRLDPAQYDPLQLRHWYGLRSDQDGRGQTIVITTFWNSPGLRQAVLGFSLHYGLPRPCPIGHGCFELTVAHPIRGLHAGAGETDLDVEWAHAIAPEARIVVLEARTPDQVAKEIEPLARAGAHVVSSSWSSGHADSSARLYRAVAASCAARETVCLFASGDDGTPGAEPANSPDVLAVGGVRFSPEADGSTQGEIAWAWSGGGATNVIQPQPSWQTSSASHVPDYGAREIPDVSALASAVPYYVAGDRGGWFIGDGTSLATPLWAALIAITNQQLISDRAAPIGILELHNVLYEGMISSGLDDITKGPRAGPRWDISTGLGSPKSGIVDVLVKAIERYRASHQS